MAFVPEAGNWPAGITQLEQTDLVQAGPGGKANMQAEELAIRTAILRVDFDTFEAGEITMTNRGVIKGCDLSKSAGATRNLDITTGRAFRGGRSELVLSGTNAAAVTNNTTGQAQTVQAYLDNNGDLVVTAIGASPPADALVLADLLIPDNSTEITDPYLANVTITPLALAERAWPTVMLNAPSVVVSVPSQTPGDADPFTVDLEVVDWDGGLPAVMVTNRTDNTFTITLLGAADNVVVRYQLAAYGAP